MSFLQIFLEGVGIIDLENQAEVPEVTRASDVTEDLSDKIIPTNETTQLNMNDFYETKEKYIEAGM